MAAPNDHDERGGGTMSGLIHKVMSKVLRRLGEPVLDLAPTLAGDAKWHQDFIIHLVSVLKPKTYVELGIFHCGLFNRMVPFAERLIGVDASPEAGGYMVRSPKVRFVAATTDAFSRELEKNPIEIDFLFIDADHSKEAVASDFRNFLRFVRPHGFVAIHDTHPCDMAATDPARCGDGFLTIEALSRQSSEWEMVTVPVHPGLTLCRKRTRQLSWMEPDASR